MDIKFIQIEVAIILKKIKKTKYNLKIGFSSYKLDNKPHKRSGMVLKTNRARKGLGCKSFIVREICDTWEQW